MGSSLILPAKACPHFPLFVCDPNVVLLIPPGISVQEFRSFPPEIITVPFGFLAFISRKESLASKINCLLRKYTPSSNVTVHRCFSDNGGKFIMSSMHFMLQFHTMCQLLA